MKNIIKFILAISAITLLSACGGGDGDTNEKSIGDLRFNGTFVYSYDWVAPDGVNESHHRDTLVFDGTNFANNTRYSKRYLTGSGWRYTGNYIGDSIVRVVEFELNSQQQYRQRIASGPLFYDTKDWSPWADYSFSNDGKSLTLKGDYAYHLNNDNSVTLNKK
jgi:hypothetical protein